MFFTLNGFLGREAGILLVNKYTSKTAELSLWKLNFKKPYMLLKMIRIIIKYERPEGIVLVTA